MGRLQAASIASVERMIILFMIDDLLIYFLAPVVGDADAKPLPAAGSSHLFEGGFYGGVLVSIAELQHLVLLVGG